MFNIFYQLLNEQKFADGGEVKTKKVIRRNLPINTEYKIIDSFYTGGISENPMSCDNCGKLIANVAVVENTDGDKYHVGMDCAETLSGIKDSLEFIATNNDFNEAKAIRAKINNAFKKYTNGKLEVKNLPDGSVKLEYEDEGNRTMVRVYVAKQWFNKFLPDYKNKISNKDKNDFYPKFDANYDFNFNFETLRNFVDGKKVNYIAPKEIKVGDYKAVVSHEPHTILNDDGKAITNDTYLQKLYDSSGKLINEDTYYMWRDIQHRIIWEINEYEFNNFNK